MRPTKKPSSSSKKYPPGSFIGKVRKRRIIETLAAFIGGGWLTWEAVHWILVEHYHFPEKLLDITLVTIIGAMLSTLTWRWLGGREKKTRRIKLELILIPLFILITAFLDVRFIQQIGKPEAETISEKRWKNSIAVLPFANISPEEGQEYFCDGLTEELISRLSNVKELKVVARTSAFSYKGMDMDVREIGRKLNVDKALEGSVRKEGDRLRITAQLINIADGYHLWSEKFDRKLDDIFAIQDEISMAIVDGLKIKILVEEEERLTKHYTENLEAYNLYLLGLHHWNRFTEEDVNTSIKYFEEAIKRDPNYALAYTGLADCYVQFGLGHGSGTHVPLEMYQKAKDTVTKALEIDDALAEAYMVLGFIHFAFEFDWESGEQDFKRAIQLKPNLAQSETRYALLLQCLGRYDEAIEKGKRAVELDPLSPILYTDLADSYLFARRYDQAIASANKALELDPNFHIAYHVLACVYRNKRMFTEAIKEIRRAISLSNSVFNIALLGNIYGLSQRRDGAQKILNDLLELRKQTYVSALEIARVYIGLGERTKTIDWLEIAVEEHAHWIAMLNAFDDFKVLHSDPRFIALLERMSFETE